MAAKSEPMDTIRVAAEKIGVTNSYLAQLIRKKRLRAIKERNAAVACGYQWMIPQSEVERLRNEPKAVGRPRTDEGRRKISPSLPTKAKSTPKQPSKRSAKPRRKK